ncbi:MAG: O-antigen ligase family protein [Pseudomonadota bacterium]
MLLFVLPLWPDFAELKPGGIPNIAPPRLVRAALIFLAVIYLFQDRERAALFGKRLRENWIPVTLLLAFFSLRFASGFVARFPVLQIFVFVRNDLWSYLSIFFITLFVLRDERDVKRVMQIIVVAGMIVGMAALLEYFLKRNLFQRFISVTSDYMMAVLSDKTRDNTYRAQGTLEHPLLLGQFFAMILPWCWYTMLYSERRLFRLIACVSGVLGVTAIYVCGSRSSFAIAIPLVALMFIWELWRWTLRSHNRPAQYLILLQFPLLLGAFAGVLFYLKKIAAGTTQVTQGSASIRLEMLNSGMSKLSDALFLGHGLGEATSVVSFVGKGGVKTLDNYYLVIALESGMIALMLNALLWLYFLFSAFSQSRDKDTGRARISMLLGLSVLGYIIVMSIHSLQGLTWLLFVIFGCLLVLKDKRAA